MISPESSPTWRQALNEVALQEPLIRTRLSLAALEQACACTATPGAVFIGLGLCSPDQLSQGLPLDIIGLLLPAERIRRAVGASALVVLVADSHALLNRFDRREVARSTEEVCAALDRARWALGLDALRVTRATSLHAAPAYREALKRVERVAPDGAGAYFTREAADIAHLQRELGGIVKVGWSISGAPGPSHVIDELAFDRSFCTWTGEPLCAVYCKAGRALDDQRPKASPYITLRPERRICLRVGEDVAGKLALGAQVASGETVRGVRNHLKAMTRSYAQLVEPLEGPLERRAQHMLDRLTGGLAK